MNPDQQFQTPPPFSFPFDHHHRNNNGDSHRTPRRIHHPYAKGDVVNNKENEDEENGHMGANKGICPSTTMQPYIITLPSCPSSSTTSANSSSSSSVTPANGYRRHQSKKLQVLSSPFPTETDEFYAKHIGIASVLAMSYLIEVIVQVLLTIQCYYFFQQPAESLAAEMPGEVASSTTPSSWSWFLVVGSVLSSLLVTLISIAWVFRGMDFSGRLCGRLLCYVMHSFLLGLLWRYLKLAFAYDRVDLEEFFKLRAIQAYVQSLPLVTIHLAWILATQQQLFPVTTTQQITVDSYHALSSWLVVVEMLSTVISLLILSSSNVSSSTSKSHNTNLQGVVAEGSPCKTTSPGTITSYHQHNGGKDCGTSNKLKLESGKGDNNPNHHFNDSGTASSVDNHGTAGDENDTAEKSSCSLSSFSLKMLMTLAIKRMMSHYSQKCEPGRALLLVSRVISLGMLVYKMNYYWTGFIALLHFGVSFAWLGCWAIVASGNSNSSIKVVSSVSPTARPCKRVNDSDDICCDSRSDGSSNDSGLVVKSELESGNPAVVNISAEPNACVVNADNNDGEEDHAYVSHGVNAGTRAAHQVKSEIKGEHVSSFNSMSGGLASCLSVVVHRRNNAGIDSNSKLQENNGLSQCRGNRRQVLMHVLPVVYLLFWDLSNSSISFYLRTKNSTLLYKLNAWATAVPVLLVLVENVFITVYHHISMTNDDFSVRIVTLTSATCLVLGWFLIAVHQFRWKSSNHEVQKPKNEQSRSRSKEEDDADSGYGKNKGNSCIRGGGTSDGSLRGISKKETGECLSFCCSSLSHPLNIKRKGSCNQEHQQDETHSFCKDGSTNDKLSPVENQHQPRDVTTAKYNEYQEQLDLGRLMSAQRRKSQFLSHNIKSNDNDSVQQAASNSRSNSTTRKSRKSSTFPDFTGKDEYENNIDTYIKPGDDSKMTTKGSGTRSNACTPVTNNNYTNIKEALTRRISNKSSGTGSLKKPHPSQSYNQINQDRESVKEDRGEMEEGEARVAISSFKSSSSPSTRLHQQYRQQQHQPSATNSNKCMPISIKSPISWLPETCCNDSSGDSSNSRNTNTLVMPEPTATTSENRLFYCPEKYIDLGNNNTTREEATEESKRTSRKQQPKQQRQHYHNQISEKEEKSDFSIVFFEGRTGGGTCRSYKQKQSRTPVASNALLFRAARSANTTPVASSKPFPLDMRATTSATVQNQNHPHFQPSLLHNHHHHHQYDTHEHLDDDDDDGVDPIEQAAKAEGATQRRIRNQITGKTYLSDGASLTSIDGLCEIRASTPVEIKKASRVIVNYPPPHHKISDSKTVSRCLCKVDTSSSPEGARNNSRKRCGMSPLVFSDCENDHPPAAARASGNSNNNNIYEKLIDDSYGILICEGENAPGRNSVSKTNGSNKSKCSNNDTHHYHHQIVGLSEAAEMRRTVVGGGASQKLKILCAKCLENHDPLLTNCVDPLKIVDDGNLPEVIDYYTNPADIHNLAMLIDWQEQQEASPNQEYFQQGVSHSPYAYTPCDSDTTDYPSDTEFTVNNNVAEDDGQSLSTHFSSVTCTKQNYQHHQNNYHHHQAPNQNHHEPKPTQLSQFIWAASTMLPTLRGCDDGDGNSSQQQCPKEFTGLEYVRTWLMASHPRTFALNNLPNNNISSSKGYNNNTHQHPHHEHRPQAQHENGIKRNGKNSNASHQRYTSHHHSHLQGRNDKGLSPSSATSKGNHSSPFKTKSACDKTISKKKRFRQLEKRQRPVGRGASPPPKEPCTNSNGKADVLNDISATATTTPSTNVQTITNAINTTAAATRNNPSIETARFQPPPSRKQHPVLFYDMIPQQERQKSLTATSHKKCRDQLDLFHKELETVV